MEGALGIELEWTFDESDWMRRRQDGDFTKAPVRKAVIHVIEKAEDA